MQSLLRIWPVVLVAVVLASCFSNTACAKRSGRAAVAARQHVRAQLAKAVADGELSRVEQYRILLDAKDLLDRDELEGLQQTLDRLASRQKAPLLQETSTLQADIRDTGDEADIRDTGDEADIRDTGDEADKRDTGDEADKGEPTTPAGVLLADQKNKTKTASYYQPADAPFDDSPFREETPEESAGEYYDGCCDEYCDGCSDAFCGILGDETGMFADGRSIFEDRAARRLKLNHSRLLTSVCAFKGPLDVGNLNSNFGVCFAIDGGFPLIEKWGIGVQAGTSAVLADFHGRTPTSDTIRTQNFTTAGMFQRIPTRLGYLSWGFALDWLYDDYYSVLKMSQYRVKLGYELNPRNEIGIWSCIPNQGDIGHRGQDRVRFKPLAQGNLYYRRCWDNEASITGWIGVAEKPSEFIFGGEARIPFSWRLALLSNFNYVLPNASSVRGQDKEMWSVSVGIELLFGRNPQQCRPRRFTPLFPLADNSTFAIRRY